MNISTITIGILIIINTVTFFVMATDKRRSLKGKGSRRISEGYLFFMASVFGGAGVYLGMLLFRHKTRKWYFQLGIPLLIAQNAATIYLFWKLFIL